MTDGDANSKQHVVEADKAWSIEQHAIEPIPAADRHGTPIELFRMWIGANINYVVVVTGSLTYAKGLSFYQCMSAILVGNLLGCTVLGLCSIMGPKTGSAGIITTRTSFGQLGALLPMAISLVSALSWFSIQSVVATQAFEQLLKIGGFGGPLIIWISLTIVLAAEILLALFGHATIIAAEKWIAVILAILFAGLGCFVIPHVPAQRIALCAGGGQFVALVFCQIIGVLFAIALKGALGDDPVSQLQLFLPTWFIVPLLFAIILGGVAANVPNGYTAALGMLALRVPITRDVAAHHRDVYSHRSSHYGLLRSIFRRLSEISRVHRVLDDAVGGHRHHRLFHATRPVQHPGPGALGRRRRGSVF